jgi:hypothetical protein
MTVLGIAKETSNQSVKDDTGKDSHSSLWEFQ